MDAQKRIKPAKFIKGSKEKNIPREVGGKDDPCVMEHNCVMDTVQLNKRDRTVDSLPTTPVKNPAGKKPKIADDGENSEVSNNAILQAILGLEKRVDVQLADLKEQTKQSSVMIASLAKAVQFNAEEMKECKKKVEDLKKQNDQLCKDNDDLKNRVREQERYRMRWCLQIKGLEEKRDENIREQVTEILRKIAPDLESKVEDAVDVVHRMGRKMDNKIRHVVILFAKRWVKEEIWRRTKNSQVCKDKGIRFAEMLPREDWEERRRLWAQIEQARRAGKLAFFRGPHGYVDGRRIGDER